MQNMFNTSRGNASYKGASVTNFEYLIGQSIYNIINFDDSTYDIKESGKIILPRYYHVCVGMKDDEPQYKSFGYDKYRIVVSTYKSTVVSIDSIG